MQLGPCSSHRDLSFNVNEDTKSAMEVVDGSSLGDVDGSDVDLSDSAGRKGKYYPFPGDAQESP